MGFADIGIAYHIYLHYTKKLPSLAYHKDTEKMKIQCMYDLYGANNIQEIIDVLEQSGLRMIKSGEAIFLMDDIIKKFTPYITIYGALEHLDREIGES